MVLLCEHPEGHNKIQDKYKSEEVVVGRHPEPNVYYIKPVNGNGKTQNDGGLASTQDNHNGPQVPSFNPKLNLTKSPQIHIIMPLAQKGDLHCFP